MGSFPLRTASTANAGALSATGNPSYQEAFGAPVPGFAHIPYGDVEALKRTLRNMGKRPPL